jgi:hypothetical protein
VELLFFLCLLILCAPLVATRRVVDWLFDEVPDDA